MTPSERGHAPAPPRRRQHLRVALVLSLALAISIAGPGAAIVDISVTDAAIATVESNPSSAAPGPIVHAPADGLTFSSSTTNAASAWYAEFYSVTNSTGAASATIQGTSYTFADWFYGKQDSNTKYSTMNMTGVYDADAGSYSVPALFTKSSQGTLSVRYYDGTSPTKDGTTVTMYWAYNANSNKYVIGTAKDLSLETQVAPITDTLEVAYEKTIQGNDYIISAVAASGSNYVPTLKQGHHLPLLSLPLSHTWYPLMDPPLGVHRSDYDYTVQVTTVGV